MKTAVVILNWNTRQYLQQFLPGLVKSVEEMATILENDARKIYLLQEILKDYGTTLFVCIAPSKNELYPEFLPENDKYFSQGGIHADDFYVKRFTELGVNFLDLNTLYKEIKDTVDYPLFYKAASHYSIIAATYTVDTLIKYMESVSELNIQNIEFEEPYIDKPIAIDRDIENLLNLMRPIEKTDYYYVHTTTIPDSTAVTPRWLSIGDSFYWNIRNEETVDEVFNESPFWYYANTIHYDKHNKWKTKDVDLIEELVFSDFVMIIWCPINIYELERNNIINNSLLSLCYDEKYLEKNRQNIITEIKNSPEWYQSIERQAEKENKNIEETLLNNANYLLRDPGSNRLTEIKGYDVPEVRNSRLKTIKNISRIIQKRKLLSSKRYTETL